VREQHVCISRRRVVVVVVVGAIIHIVAYNPKMTQSSQNSQEAATVAACKLQHYCQERKLLYTCTTLLVRLLRPGAVV